LTDRRSTAVAALVSVVLLVLAVGVIHARDRANTFDERDLPAPYVPPAAMVSRVVLSFDAVAADVYWVRAILHDGQERQANRSDPRFPLLEPLVNVAVSLDPRFNIAYRIGAILMALNRHSAQAAPIARSRCSSGDCTRTRIAGSTRTISATSTTSTPAGSMKPPDGSSVPPRFQGPQAGWLRSPPRRWPREGTGRALDSCLAIS
jgi:hypothetical protein